MHSIFEIFTRIFEIQGAAQLSEQTQTDQSWVPVNRFQRSIPYFEGHLMPFKMRYKVLHNYFPIKFYRSNCFGLIWLHVSR